MVRQDGFSAVELLITLFIAAIFVATGYQLYSVIIKNGAETNQRAIASGIAYENLRRYAPKSTNPCTPVTPNPTPSIPANSSLANSSITVSYTCPYGAGGTGGLVTRVAVSVKYGNPQQEVVHAIFVSN
ncbi:MAG TPA: prepilin-type N-terminal cleavage/methylation domain-containing protein [Candidatus Saccharimonadales bacterium]|nr:prepilin-type N-terminal cleavage/methylation domain-containing protein [Candidatus Saccharimonadales bacterium]